MNRFEGECHPMAKLSVHQVRAIRGHYQSGLSSRTIAEMFDISRSTVNRIVSGMRWGHVPTKDLIADALETLDGDAGRLSVERNSRVK